MNSICPYLLYIYTVSDQNATVQCTYYLGKFCKLVCSLPTSNLIYIDINYTQAAYYVKKEPVRST